jgi:hypothetical protein
MACVNGESRAFRGSQCLSLLVRPSEHRIYYNDPGDNKKKIWSETNVSEDFDMVLHLQVGVYCWEVISLSYCRIPSRSRDTSFRVGGGPILKAALRKVSC